VFAVWLSGEGGSFPTKDGRLTREVLLKYFLDRAGQIEESRWGLRGTGGAALVIATGGTNPEVFDGLKLSGFDFRASLDENWGALANGVKGLGLITQIARAKDFFSASKLTAKQWQATAVVIRDAYKGTKAAALQPGVGVLAIPGAGGGVEFSSFYASGQCSVI
jgi:hypothetical protein